MFQSDESHTKWAKDRDIPKVSYRWGEGASISSRSADEKYAGEIRYMDSQLQRIFDALKSSGEWENTILIITADHGEGLGQHGAPGHGGLLWKEQLHVPLIIHSPFHPPKRVSDIAWSVNIFPTVLSLIDLPNEESFLSQATRPSEFSPKSTDIVLSEVGEGHRSVTTLNWKYIAWNDNSHSLFSLSTDPYELNDISAENTETAEKMFWKLQARVESFRTRAKQFESGKTEQMSPEQIDLLHALGYVSDDHQVEANSARNTNEEAATANEQKRLRSPKHRGQARRPDARK
jgi:arylsulfatase A-like enzyme